MTKRKHRAARAVFLIFLLLLTLLLGAAALCAGLALTDNNQDKYTITERDTSFSDDVLKGALFGKEFTLSEKQLNTYAELLFCRENDSRSSYLKNIRLYFHDEDNTEIYARLHFWDHDFSLYARASIEQQAFSGEAAVKLHDVKIGELPLPDLIVDSVLKRVASDKEYVRYQDGTIYVQTKFEYDLGNSHFTVRLKKLTPGEGYVTCRTNSLSVEALKAIYSYLESDDGKELSRKIFGSDMDDWKKWISDKIFSQG